jgi:hypothetical protein
MFSINLIFQFIFVLDAERWEKIAQEPTGDYGDDFLYFILAQELGNFFNLPLYTVNSLDSLDFPLSNKEQLERMALTPFFGRSRAGKLWNPWDRSSSSLFVLWVPVSGILDVFYLGNALESQAFSFSREVQDIANTTPDWKETPEAHIFTVDMLGKSHFSLFLFPCISICSPLIK